MIEQYSEEKKWWGKMVDLFLFGNIISPIWYLEFAGLPLIQNQIFSSLS